MSRQSDKPRSLIVGHPEIPRQIQDARFENPATKTALATLLANDIKARCLSQDRAALILGTQQSKVSRIMRGQVHTGISQAKLLEMLMKFGHDVTIVVDPVQPREGRARLQVVAKSKGS